MIFYIVSLSGCQLTFAQGELNQMVNISWIDFVE